MAEISWIKLSTGLPDNKKIKRIRKLPDGDKVILFWVFLLARAGESNKNGGLFLTDTLAYSTEDLSADFDFSVEFVQFALITLEKYSMITRYDEVLFIKNWEEYQAIEGMAKIREQNRIRKQRQREKEKQLVIESRDGHVTSQQSHATDIDKDIDIEIKNIDSRKSRKRVYEDDSPYLKLANYLYKKINDNGSIKEPNLQSWADDLRKMVELDKRSIEKVKQMIDWCQKDNFWCSNILSAKKLREKYDTMARQANRKPSNFSGQRKGRVEKLPDYIINPPKPPSISPEKEAEVKRKMAEFLERQEDDQ